MARRKFYGKISDWVFDSIAGHVSDYCSLTRYNGEPDELKRKAPGIKKSRKALERSFKSEYTGFQVSNFKKFQSAGLGFLIWAFVLFDYF